MNPQNLNGVSGLTFTATGLAQTARLNASGAGDINNDGIDDLVLGLTGFGQSPFANRGAVFVVYGSRSAFPAVFELADLDPSTGQWAVGVSSRDVLGSALDAAGDVNGDGIDDFIVGAREAGVGGEAYVIFGGDGINSATPGSLITELSGVALRGTVFGDQAGWSVSGAGDENGDGLDDVIVGAPYADPGFAYEGESYLVYGNDPNRIYANGFER